MIKRELALVLEEHSEKIILGWHLLPYHGEVCTNIMLPVGIFVLRTETEIAKHVLFLASCNFVFIIWALYQNVAFGVSLSGLLWVCCFVFLEFTELTSTEDWRVYFGDEKCVERFIEFFGVDSEHRTVKSILSK